MNPSYNHLDDVPWQIRDRLRGTGSADQQQDEQMSTPVNRLTRTFPDHYSPITDTNSPDRHQTTTQLQQLGSAIISAGHNQQVMSPSTTAAAAPAGWGASNSSGANLGTATLMQATRLDIPVQALEQFAQEVPLMRPSLRISVLLLSNSMIVCSIGRMFWETQQLP